MALACPACSLDNLLHHEACGFCSAPLLAPGEAAGKRAEWEALSEKLRVEFSANYERGLAARLAWRERLRTNRIRHAIAGAFLFAVCVFTLHGAVLDVGGFPAVLLFLAELAVGAGLGLLVNRQGGGGFVALAAFGGAYGFWTVLSLFAGWIRGPLSGDMGSGFVWGAFVLPGGLALATFGYLFGLSLSMRRSLEE